MHRDKVLFCIIVNYIQIDILCRVPKYNNKESCLSGAVVYFGCMYVVDFFPSLDTFQWKKCEEKHIREYKITQEQWQKYQEKYNAQRPEHIVKNGCVQNTMCSRILDHIIRISDHFKSNDIGRFYKRGNCQMIKTTQIKKIPNPSLCRDNHNEMVTWMYALGKIFDFRNIILTEIKTSCN